MLNCPWEKKYTAELERARKEAATWDGFGKNWAADDVQRVLAKQHTLSVDHRMGGCICQAARPLKEIRK